MIGLRLTVPLACFRKGAARELFETEMLPPPSTCYGALLSLVGETDRERHQGCRVSAGLLNKPEQSTVLRTLWRIKDEKIPQGNKSNARPDFQQLVVLSDLMLWCDSEDEPDISSGLETRVREAMRNPASVDRFGGWSLGESTHLINDAWVLDDGTPPSECQAFLLDPGGDVTLPVWVDHVGSAGTQYAVGRLVSLSAPPAREKLPQIMSAPSDLAGDAPPKAKARSKR